MKDKIDSSREIYRTEDGLVLDENGSLVEELRPVRWSDGELKKMSAEFKSHARNTKELYEVIAAQAKEIEAMKAYNEHQSEQVELLREMMSAITTRFNDHMDIFKEHDRLEKKAQVKSQQKMDMFEQVITNNVTMIQSMVQEMSKMRVQYERIQESYITNQEKTEQMYKGFEETNNERKAYKKIHDRFKNMWIMLGQVVAGLLGLLGLYKAYIELFTKTVGN